MPSALSPSSGSDPRQQRWPWWPLLPLYPYGCRPTLVRELVPDRIWSFEQLHGVWYVAVPIRMTVVRVSDGLLLYAPLPPTAEVLSQLRDLERRIGPVRAIVLPTSSGLEHKLPVPAMARAFPQATVWVTNDQWSFPLRLPPSWLGFPSNRTRVLLKEDVPYGDQLEWHPLGPLDLGLGTFLELACFDRDSGSLLVTDALVSISTDPPPIFDLDPTPLLFHARERGSEPLTDTVERRKRGWLRLVCFANYLRPNCLEVPSLREVLADAFAPGCRNAQSHFGLYPFRWLTGWEHQAARLTFQPGEPAILQLAPVLERLVFVRQKDRFLQWLDTLISCPSVRRLIPAHYDAPVAIGNESLWQLKADIQSRQWAPDDGSWRLMARIDQALKSFGLVP